MSLLEVLLCRFPTGGSGDLCGKLPSQALVSTNHDRAAPKGLGAVKAAGNYAADLSPVHGAHAQGYNTTLYLDAKQGKYVEEFSVCNFVGITKDEASCRIMRLLRLYLEELWSRPSMLPSSKSGAQGAQRR